MLESPNLNYIKKLSGDDPEFEEKLIAIIKWEFPDECKEFRDNFDQKNYKAASQNVHKLKHKFSILGLEKSYQLADDFENDLRQAEHSRFKEFDEVLELISLFLNKI